MYISSSFASSNSKTLLQMIYFYHTNFCQDGDLEYETSARLEQMCSSVFVNPYEQLLLMEMLTAPIAWRSARCHCNEMSVRAKAAQLVSS